MTTLTKYTTTGAAGAEVHTRAERYAAAHSCTYREGVIATLAADKELAQAYAENAPRVTARKPLRPRPAAPAPVQMAPGIPAGETVHSRAQALTEKTPSLTYRQAVHQVLDDDPALKTNYAGVQR